MKTHHKLVLVGLDVDTDTLGVAEDAFRPAWLHRYIMSELIGLVRGLCAAKAAGFVPSGISLHKFRLTHGPDGLTLHRPAPAYSGALQH